MSGTARTWPHLRAREARVRGEGWLLVMDGQPTPLGESHDTWDPTVDLIFRRRMLVDVDGILADCALPPATSLRIVTTWHSEGTYLRDVGTRSPLPPVGVGGIHLDVRVPGALAGGRLHLHVAVVLGEDIPPAPLRPHRQGTILWAQDSTLALEGAGSRFPLEAISFQAEGARFPDHAAWRLEWDESDLELPVLGSVRLYLNQDHPVVQRMLEAPKDELSRVLFSSLEVDVARLLIEGALRSDTFVGAAAEWPDDSVGRAVERLLKSRFPRESRETLRATLDRDLPGFNALVQDRLGLFRVS